MYTFFDRKYEVDIRNIIIDYFSPNCIKTYFFPFKLCLDPQKLFFSNSGQ